MPTKQQLSGLGIDWPIHVPTDKYAKVVQRIWHRDLASKVSSNGVWLFKYDARQDIYPAKSQGTLVLCDAKAHEHTDKRLWLIKTQDFENMQALLYKYVDVVRREGKWMSALNEDAMKLVDEAVEDLRKERERVEQLRKKNESSEKPKESSDKPENAKETDGADKRKGRGDKADESGNIKTKISDVICIKNIESGSETVVTAAPLARHSPVLEKMIKGARTTFEDHYVLKLNNTSGTTFYMFCQWITNGRISNDDIEDLGAALYVGSWFSHPLKHVALPSATLDDLPPYKNLIDLWLLGKSLECSGVMRAVADAVIKKSSMSLPDVDEIKYLCKETTKDDAMRLLFCYVMVSRPMYLSTEWPKEFYDGVVDGLKGENLHLTLPSADSW